MKILMLSPEVTPFASVGGLGDVTGSLPMELSNINLDVRVFMPKHGCLKLKETCNLTEIQKPICVYLGNGLTKVAKVWETYFSDEKTKLYLLEYNQYFERNEIYSGPWGEHADNHERFAFFCRASLDFCYSINWIPDVIHCHDWTTGLLPVMLNTIERNKPLGRCATVFTIHNLRHQGIFHKSILDFAGIPYSEYKSDSLECLNAVNFMKGGIYHATKLTTVSPNYSREIQNSEFGCGLDSVLRFRSADLIGVLNGIDTKLWNSKTDKYLPANYDANDLSGKKICKEKLQKYFNLKLDKNIPVFAIVARLYDQKGIDLVLEKIPSLLENMSIQIVLIGSGETWIENELRNLHSIYPTKLGLHIGYNPELAHLAIAGSDFFLMPSRFEPCGLTQLYSMAYGTLPIVHRTGGLADTVTQYVENFSKKASNAHVFSNLSKNKESLNESSSELLCDRLTSETNEHFSTGFLFDDLTPNAIYDTIGWACSTFYDRPKDIKFMQKNAMNSDFSWTRSALAYKDVYSWAIEARKMM